MTLTSSSAYFTNTLTDLDIVTLFHRHTTFLTFLLVILNSLFGCVCQPMIDEYDDDDDETFEGTITLLMTDDFVAPSFFATGLRKS